MAEDRQEQDRSPEADLVALIERSLVAVRRDQSRRRPPGPWEPGPFPGYGHGNHAAAHGTPREPDDGHGHASHTGQGGSPARADNGRDADASSDNAPTAAARGATDGDDSAHADTERGDSAGSANADHSHPDTHDHHTSHSHPAHGFDGHGWGARGPWGGFPGPFGDSARPGPGRRGRDGSVGRFARIRMLEALAEADAEGRQLSVSSLAAAIGVDQPRASRLVQEGVDRGLVRRVPDPSDARRALIQLTTAGRSQLGEVHDHRRSAVETALASFTPEEVRTFAELFDRFVRAWPR